MTDLVHLRDKRMRAVCDGLNVAAERPDRPVTCLRCWGIQLAREEILASGELNVLRGFAKSIF